MQFCCSLSWLNKMHWFPVCWWFTCWLWSKKPFRHDPFCLTEPLSANVSSQQRSSRVCPLDLPIGEPKDYWELCLWPSNLPSVQQDCVDWQDNEHELYAGWGLCLRVGKGTGHWVWRAYFCSQINVNVQVGIILFYEHENVQPTRQLNKQSFTAYHERMPTEKEKMTSSLPKDEEGVQWLQLKVLPASANSSLPWRWPRPESKNVQQKEQLFTKGMMRCGRQELVATMGRVLQLWYGCISILTAACVMGQLLATCLCCKDSSWIPCVATSGRILLSIQKLQTSPYGCYTTNQGTYQCYFCCLIRTIPQQFCFCFIHNRKKI